MYEVACVAVWVGEGRGKQNPWLTSCADEGQQPGLWLRHEFLRALPLLPPHPPLHLSPLPRPGVT
jgi:hypothetical protein